MATTTEFDKPENDTKKPDVPESEEQAPEDNSSYNEDYKTGPAQ